MEQDGDTEQQYVPGEGKDVTLEHILPINPGSEWKHIAPDDAKANYNRLGNQALLAGSVNSKLGNIGFAIKKPILAKSPYSLTRLAAKGSTWGVKEISARQKTLANLAVKAWPFR